MVIDRMRTGVAATSDPRTASRSSTPGVEDDFLRVIVARAPRTPRRSRRRHRRYCPAYGRRAVFLHVWRRRHGSNYHGDDDAAWRVREMSAKVDRGDITSVRRSTPCDFLDDENARVRASPLERSVHRRVIVMTAEHVSSPNHGKAPHGASMSPVELAMRLLSSGSAMTSTSERRSADQL